MVDETIVNEILLQGGDQVVKDFRSMGDAGESSLNRIAQAFDKAGNLGTKLGPAIDTIKAKFKEMETAAGNVGAKLSDFGEAARTSVDRISLIGVAVVGAAAGFVLLVKNAGLAVDQVGKAATAAGQGTKEFQNLVFALGKSGVEADSVGLILNRMNRAMGASQKSANELSLAHTKLREEYLKGTLTSEQFLQQQMDLDREAGRAVNIYNQLGVSAATVLNDPHEAFLQLVDAFARMPTGIEKSNAELEIFGRNGTRIATAANEGRKGILELEKEGQRIAPAFVPAEIAIGTKLTEAFFSAGQAADNTKDRLLLTFAPALTGLVNAFTETIVNNRGTLQGFATAIEAAIRPAIEDIIKLLQGKEVDPTSFIGKVRSAMITLATDIGKAIGLIVAAWNGFIAVLDPVARAINAVFGTQLTGQALAIAAAIAAVTGAFSFMVAGITLIVSVVGLLVATFGGAEVAIGALGVAIGFVLGQVLVASLDQIPAKANTAWQALVEGAQGTLINFQNLFNSIGELGGAVWQIIVQKATIAWDAIVAVASAAWDQLAAFPGNFVIVMTAAFQAGINGIQEMFSGLLSFAQSQLLQIPSWLQSIIDLGSRAAQAIASVGSGSSNTSPSGFAGGGPIVGAGTGTSDSNLIFASDGEFMHQAAAVRKYGLRFMHMINNLQFDPAGFALGGLINFNAPRSPQLRFAGGGPIVGRKGNILNLTIGSEQFLGLAAEDDTMNKLTRYAVTQQVRSAGRKPTWKK